MGTLYVCNGSHSGEESRCESVWTSGFANSAREWFWQMRRPESNTTEQPMIYTNWHQGSPDNALGVQNHVKITAYKDDMWSWDDVEGSKSYCYICEAWTIS